MKKTVILIIVLNILLAIFLYGCDNTSNEAVLSKNMVDFDKDAINEELIIKMVKGKHYEDSEPGPFMGWKWEGRFVAELKDIKGKPISTFELNNAFFDEPLIFKDKFSIEFEDYNNDGCIDFTVGQYASSNSYLYRMFSISKDGSITMLPSDKGTGVFNNNAGYSARFEKVDNLTFKTRCYDNVTSQFMEYQFKWVNNRFENVASQEINGIGFEGAEEDEEQNKQEVDNLLNEVKNLTMIEMPNLNDANNRIVKMNLKEGWAATQVITKKAEGFDYNDKKNKSINEISEYIIYDEKKQEIGWLGDISVYKGHEKSAFPNHMQWRKKVYEGNTKLGSGEIYLLKLDLFDMQKTKDKDSFYQYYALIPIYNEELAYNFFINIPYEAYNGERTDILGIMKDILGAEDDIEKQIADLFQGNETSLVNEKKIIHLLPVVNWSQYASRNLNGFFDIMEWLGNLKIDNQVSMVSILTATNGLDGAYTEVYCSAVKNIFFNNTDVFVEALDDLYDDQIKLVSSFVHYGCKIEEVNQVKDYFKNISVSNNEISRKVDRAKLFLEAFK